MRSRRIYQATRIMLKKAGKFLTRRSIKVAKVRVAPLTLLLLVFALPSLLQGYIYWQERELNKLYSFVEDKESLLGKKSAKLAAYIQEDKEKQAYLFNEEGLPSDSAPLTNLQQTVQSEDSQTEPLFSAEIGIDKPEVTIHDNQLGVNFSSELLLDTLDGRKDESWVVYPALDENVTVVYSVKNNGIKEDIVIKQATSDEMSFTYKLNLPKSLDAKLLDDGSLGVYSSDPSQYSNMTFGSEADRELIEKVKENAEKTYLAFVIPKPVIVAENGSVGDAFASFTYDRETQQLTVKGYKLTSIEGVFSIDPTTVVTSTADFGSGNDEAGTDFLTSNAISNPTVRGGRIGSWSNANTGGNAGGARVNQATVVYNGYAYIIGGWTGSVQSRIDYGPINSSGNVTSWTQNGTSLPAARTAHKAVAYNGYMYVIGGCNAYTNYGSPYFNNCTPGTNKNHDAGLGGAWMRSVTYAPINSDGSLGAWTTDTDYFTNAREWHAAGVYNGRLYIAGGRIDSYPGTANTVNDVQYADILTDGSIGAWTTDGGTSFTTERMYTEMNIYNGYMYIIGGNNEEGAGDQSDVQYAPINEDGSIGTWNTTTSFTTARRSHKTVIHRGYLYLVAGYNGSSLTDVQYAPINTDGTIGAWSDTTAVSSRDNVGVHAWGDYLIWLSGDYSVNYCEKSLIEPNGSIRAVSSAWPTTTTTSVFRNLTQGVAYNGNIYMVGGGNASATPQSSADRAVINADGTLGTWTTSGGSTLNTARQAHAVAVYNGYIYVVGGLNSGGSTISSTEYAPINADGTIGTWTTTTSLSGPRAFMEAVVYNGYIYVFGGDDFAGGGGTISEYAQLNSNGTIGTWATTTALPVSLANSSAYAYNGFMYVGGGDNYGTNTIYNTLRYATINSNGTLGSWNTTTSLPSNRTGHTMTINNGVMHVIGGCTVFSSGCTTWTNNVHSAPVNTDGTVGTFTATTSLTNTKWNHSTVAYNGFLYVIDGLNASNRQGTEYARMNSGGVGTTLAWTSATNSLGAATTDHASVAYNGYLYTLGGCTTYTSSNCTAFSSAVQYSAINKGGTLGTSATTTAFTTGRYGHAVAVKDGYIYILGGCSASTGGTCTNYLSDVQFARINTDGTLAAWQTGPSFTTGRHSHKVAVNGRYLYLSGGDTGTVQSGVQYAALGADGGVSSWTTTSSLGTARRDHGLVANNGYLYAVAGHSGSTILSSVEYVVANSDGTLGTWATTTPLTLPLYGHGTGVYNGRIYVSGGCSAGACTTYNNKTHQTEIFGNAHIGAWETSINNFTTARTDAGFAMHNGLIYITGGCSAGTCTTIQSNISHTGLSVYPYVSEYSRALNLGSGGRSVESFSYSGTGAGTMNVTYRAACSSTTYGSRSLLSYDVSSGERAAFVDVDADYLMVFLTLDAAFNRTFPNASQLQVQDFTVGYTAAHPDASETMRLGNTFVDQIEVGFGTRPEGTSSLGC